MRTIKLAPSILAADFARLGEQVREVEQAGADWIHVDVMDGRFVPNISIGVPVVKSLRRVTKLPLDVHLMIVEPDRYLAAFAQAGADRLTVHVEASPHLHRTVEHIHELGLKAGVALNPATPINALEEILANIDLVLVMTVNPGFGGQRFIEASLDKLHRVRSLIDATGAAVELEVDGGINVETAGDVVAAGATVLVTGSAVYRGSQSIREAVQALKQAARQGGLPNNRTMATQMGAERPER
jgi:ribulose-phosphate 3-epimerase